MPYRRLRVDGSQTAGKTRREIRHLIGSADRREHPDLGTAAIRIATRLKSVTAITFTL